MVPNLLGDSPIGAVVTSGNLEVVRRLRCFAVEELKSARRFLRALDREFDIDGSEFFTLNEHSKSEDVSAIVEKLLCGCDVGVISEAGCPGVADPGAELVDAAQRKGIRVVPMVGPSSILLSLMASGFNGQRFSFEGYLPIDSAEKRKRLRELERRIYAENQTQIFIETPYRNERMVKDLIAMCQPQTRLCIATGLTTIEEKIKTKSLAEWRREPPQIGKIPTIFLLYK